MEDRKKKLLFITHRINENDHELSFAILWIKEFIRQGQDVQVICFHKVSNDNCFPVYSLGGESGASQVSSIIRFFKLIFMLKYDCVFVHMNPKFITLGGWYWFLKGIPVYLWYTHYTIHIHLFLSGILCKRMFAATASSMPQYENNPKRVITGHGIDIEYWLPKNNPEQNSVNIKNLLSVHRFGRSKRMELAIKSLKYLPDDYALTVYSRFVPQEKEYYDEIMALVQREKLQNRVEFKKPMPMHELKNVYLRYRIMINMASETIDKTMLEGMLFGVYPVTTKNNSQAIGLPAWPENDTPESIARFIMSDEWKKYDADSLRNIVIKNHSLKALISKMNSYIEKGI